jgi:hypothetical protein
MASSAKTQGTSRLFAEIDAELRQRLDERIAAEQRSLRTVLERAIAFYLEHFPVDAVPSFPVPSQPKRGRPRKA